MYENAENVFIKIRLREIIYQKVYLREPWFIHKYENTEEKVSAGTQISYEPNAY